MQLFKHIFTEKTLAYTLLCIFFVAASVVSVIRYYQFQTFYFDFGFFDRALWLAAHFQTPLVYHPNFHGVEKIIFADHFNPSMFLLAPLYWINQKQEIFLIAQSLMVTLSGLIAYKLSLTFVKNGWTRIGLLTCYLLFVGLQNALISDIHDATLATLPLMLAFWGIQKKKWWLYFVMGLIILGFKETFAGLMIGIGLYLLWLKNYKQGIMTILFSLVYVYVVIHFIIPYFSGEQYFYASSADMSLAYLFTPFIKIKTFFFSFASFGFLPLFYPPLLPAILENFFERFSSLSDTRWGLGLHYSATLSPLFFMSCLHVVRFLEKRLGKKALSLLGIILVCLTFFLHRFILHGPLGLFYNKAFYAATSQTSYLDNFISHIPTKGLIMMQNDIAVRLTHYHVTLLDTNFVVTKPNAIAINLTPGQNPNVYFPASPEIAEKIKDRLLQDGHYRLVKYGDGLYLFLRK